MGHLSTIFDEQIIIIFEEIRHTGWGVVTLSETKSLYAI